MVSLGFRKIIGFLLVIIVIGIVSSSFLRLPQYLSIQFEAINFLSEDSIDGIKISEVYCYDKQAEKYYTYNTEERQWYSAVTLERPPVKVDDASEEFSGFFNFIEENIEGCVIKKENTRKELSLENFKRSTAYQDIVRQ